MALYRANQRSSAVLAGGFLRDVFFSILFRINKDRLTL
jgi:hypothetical protein